MTISKVMVMLKETAADDPKDTVTMDVPLLIRMLELAREDIKTDQELHDVVEKIISASKQNSVLTMEHYDSLIVS